MKTGRTINQGSNGGRVPLGGCFGVRKGRPSPIVHRKFAAFTLMELILAMAVAAMVLAAINAVFFSALRLRSSTSAMLESKASVEQTLKFIRRDLQNAVPPGAVLAGPMQSGVVNGSVGQSASENNGVEIYTSTGILSDRAPWGDIQKVTYQLEDSANATAPGKDLIRSVTRNLLSTGAEDPDDQFLMSGVASLQFSYFDGMNWLDTWDATTTTNLPQAVKVQIQMAPASNDAPASQPVEMLVALDVQTAQVATNSILSSTTGGLP